MADPRVACPLGQGFEDSEFRLPYDRLQEAGIKVDIVSATAGEELKGCREHEVIRADRGIDGIRPDQYAALLIPGGRSPDSLRVDDRFVTFVRTFDSTGHSIAAVGRGPGLLIRAALVHGRTLTASKAMRGDLNQAGANVRDAPVVIDRNGITSREPIDLPVFTCAVIRALGKGRAATEIPR